MRNRHSNLVSLDPEDVIPSATPAVAHMPIAGIDGLTADEPTTLDREPPGATSDPGEIEYASWLRLLRLKTP